MGRSVNQERAGPNQGFVNLGGLGNTGTPTGVTVSQCSTSGELQLGIFYWSN